MLGGKKGAAPDGSVFVIEFFTPMVLAPGAIFVENDKAASGAGTLNQGIASYLSPDHRDRIGQGCPLAALAS